MHNLRARKRPPSRGEEGAGLRGERQSLPRVAYQVRIRRRTRDDQPIPRRRPVGSHGAVLPLVSKVRNRVAVVVLILVSKVPLACKLDSCGDALVVEDVHELVVTVTLEKHGGVVVASGLCCVVHAHDSTGEPPLPQLHSPSNSQVTLPSPLVRSSLSGVPPTLGTLDAQLLAPTTTSAASDIPLAHRMVVPATVYTWHTAAQVARLASDMPHATDPLVCSSVSNVPQSNGRQRPAAAGERGPRPASRPPLSAAHSHRHGAQKYQAGFHRHGNLQDHPGAIDTELKNTRPFSLDIWACIVYYRARLQRAEGESELEGLVSIDI